MNEKKSHLNTIESSQNLNLKFKQFKKDIQENLNDEKNDQVIILLAKLITMLADELHIQQKSQIKHFLENNKIDIFYKSYPNIELSLTLSGSNDEKYQETFFAINQLKNSFLLDDKENIKSSEENEKFRITSLLNGWIVVGRIIAAMRKENMVDVSEKLLSEKSETFNNFLENEVQFTFSPQLEKRILFYLMLSFWIKKIEFILEKDTDLKTIVNELRTSLGYVRYIMSIQSFKKDEILLFFIHRVVNIFFIYEEKIFLPLCFNENEDIWTSFYKDSKAFLSSLDNSKELQTINIKMVTFLLEKLNVVITEKNMASLNHTLFLSFSLHSTILSNYILNKEILDNLKSFNEITKLNLKTTIFLLTKCLSLSLLILSKDKKNKYVSAYENFSLDEINKFCNRFIKNKLIIQKTLKELSLIKSINKNPSLNYLELKYTELHDKQSKNLLDFNTQLSIFKFHVANNQLEFATAQGYLTYLLYNEEKNFIPPKEFLKFILKFVLLIIQHEENNALDLLKEIYEKTKSMKGKKLEKYLKRIKVHCLLYLSTTQKNESLFKKLKKMLENKKTSLLILKADMDYLNYQTDSLEKETEIVEKNFFSDRIMNLAYLYLCISQPDIYLFKKIDLLVEEIIASIPEKFQIFYTSILNLENLKLIIKNMEFSSEMSHKDISSYIIKKYIVFFEKLKHILRKNFLKSLLATEIETFSDLYLKTFLVCLPTSSSELLSFLEDCFRFLEKNNYLLLIHYFFHTYLLNEFENKKQTKDEDQDEDNNEDGIYFFSKKPTLSDSLLEKINENLSDYLNIIWNDETYIIKSHIKHVRENDLLKILTKNGIFFSEKEKISLDENILFKNDEERFSLIKKEIIALENYRKKAAKKLLEKKKEKKLLPSGSVFSKNKEKKPTCNSKKMIRSTSERNLLDKNIPKINEKPTSSSPKKLTRSTSFNQRRTSLFDFLQKSPRGLKNTSSQLVDKQLALLKALITSKEANPAKSSAIKLHLLRIFQLTNNLHSITNTTLTTDDRNIRQLRNLILYYEYDEKSLQLVANTIINYVNKGSFDFDLMKENLLRNAKKIEKNFTSLSAILYEKYQLFLQLSQNFKSKKNLISAFQTDSNFSWQILGLIVEIVTIYKLLLKNLDLPKEQLFSENLTKLLNEANLDLRNPLCHETEFLLNEKKYEKLAGLVLKLSKKFKDEFVSLSNSSLNTSARWQT